MPPAARVGDLHACPSHGGGPLTAGSETVRIGGQPAARVGDRASCRGTTDTISQGSPTVFIEGRPAARAGDKCAHTGLIVAGLPSVIIGNEGTASGSSSVHGDPRASGSSAANTAAAATTVPLLYGTPVSTQLLNAVVSLGQSLGGTTSAVANPAAIWSAISELKLALARNDLAAIRMATSRVEAALKQEGAKDAAAASADPEAAPAAAAPATSVGWQRGSPVPADRPRVVAVHDGRVTVNDRFVGIHAISELDLIDLQTNGQIGQIVQRLVAASAAGRNCVRIFCMYQNDRSRLVPWTTAGYWSGIDALIQRIGAYGMFGEFVLLVDCERRPDGSGGAMPSWEDRRAFVREAGQFFRGKPVIVCGMNEPATNGASAADDPRLLELMRLFREASGDTVPFSIGDPSSAGDDALAQQQTLARNGASILAVRGRRQESDNSRYRQWIDQLKEFGDLRGASLAGNPYLYHSEPIAFASRRDEGRRENDPEAAVAAACVCAIGQMGFCYHRIATEDPATPGLDLARVATLIPQSPDFVPREVGAEGAPIAEFSKEDFPCGGIQTCFNGREAWAVGYGTSVAKEPRVEWRGVTPEVIWRGERAILWRAQ